MTIGLNYNKNRMNLHSVQGVSVLEDEKAGRLTDMTGVVYQLLVYGLADREIREINERGNQ